MDLMACRTGFLGIIFGLTPFTSFNQEISDSLIIPVGDSMVVADSVKGKKYRSVKPFSFITNVPGDLFRVAKAPFQKKNLKSLAIIGGTTTVLLLLDDAIIKSAGNTFKKLGIEQQESFTNLIGIGKIHFFKAPGNINSFFYQLGEPGPTFLLAGGFYLYGKITHNTRATRTAGEITESFITSFIATQTLKRITGRQSPNKATVPGGVWHWFPSLSDYNKNVTNYIAYPSGHMAAMTSVVTVIAQNYPEKKWIKPVGYTLIGLTALSMLNNKAHWASDYPLGIGIGYLSAIIAHRRNQKKEMVKKVLTL